MVDYGRDLDIGIPQEMKLETVVSKLGDVEKKVENVGESVDEAVHVLNLTKRIGEFILGEEVDEL